MNVEIHPSVLRQTCGLVRCAVGKGAAHTADNLSLATGTHMGEGENRLSHVVLRPPGRYCGVCAPHTQNRYSVKRKYVTSYSAYLFCLSPALPVCCPRTRPGNRPNRKEGKASDGNLSSPQASGERTSPAQWFTARPSRWNGTDRKAKQRAVLHPAPGADRYQPTQERPGPNGNFRTWGSGENIQTWDRMKSLWQDQNHGL